jgi:hypothetical protein
MDGGKIMKQVFSFKIKESDLYNAEPFTECNHCLLSTAIRREFEIPDDIKISTGIEDFHVVEEDHVIGIFKFDDYYGIGILGGGSEDDPYHPELVGKEVTFTEVK